MVAGCSTINLDGSIDGSVFSWSENFFLNGSVAKNVDMYVRMLNEPMVFIGGNLTYVSDEEGYISENAQLEEGGFGNQRQLKPVLRMNLPGLWVVSWSVWQEY